MKYKNDVRKSQHKSNLNRPKIFESRKMKAVDSIFGQL